MCSHKWISPCTPIFSQNKQSKHSQDLSLMKPPQWRHLTLTKNCKKTPIPPPNHWCSIWHRANANFRFDIRVPSAHAPGRRVELQSPCHPPNHRRAARVTGDGEEEAERARAMECAGSEWGGDGKLRGRRRISAQGATWQVGLPHRKATVAAACHAGRPRRQNRSPNPPRGLIRLFSIF
jgi:hypothetical protein